ncbi:Uncharacterised protein [Vibrio cholerae]|nr:Uncharacterised protein [Vibrio cholerae]CSB84595.1 Uncharacterised protein [Vibrio cholerae]
MASALSTPFFFISFWLRLRSCLIINAGLLIFLKPK